MRERYLYLADSPQGILMSGQVPEYQFWLLAEISPVHSEKVINALRDYLVMGYNRMEACGRHGVSPGYISGALKRFQRVSQTVYRLVPFYFPEAGHEVHRGE